MSRAIALGKSGSRYPGANMEFAGAPLSTSLHAEQSAILNAWMHGETSIERLIISDAPADTAVSSTELSRVDRLSIVFERTPQLSALLPEPFGDLHRPGHGPPTARDKDRQHRPHAKHSAPARHHRRRVQLCAAQRSIKRASTPLRRRQNLPWSQRRKQCLQSQRAGRHLAPKPTQPFQQPRVSRIRAATQSQLANTVPLEYGLPTPHRTNRPHSAGKSAHPNPLSLACPGTSSQSPRAYQCGRADGHG